MYHLHAVCFLQDRLSDFYPQRLSPALLLNCPDEAHLEPGRQVSWYQEVTQEDGGSEEGCHWRERQLEEGIGQGFSHIPLNAHRADAAWGGEEEEARHPCRNNLLQVS